MYDIAVLGLRRGGYYGSIYVSAVGFAKKRVWTINVPVRRRKQSKMLVTMLWRWKIVTWSMRPDRRGRRSGSPTTVVGGNDRAVERTLPRSRTQRRQNDGSIHTTQWTHLRILMRAHTRYRTRRGGDVLVVGRYPQFFSSVPCGGAEIPSLRTLFFFFNFLLWSFIRLWLQIYGQDRITRCQKNIIIPSTVRRL